MASALPKTISTRSDTTHWFFGQYLSDISDNCLPLKIEAVRLYLFKCHEKSKSRLLEKDKNEIFNQIASRFIEVWVKASLPVKTEGAIRVQIKREIKSILDVLIRETPQSVSESWKSKVTENYKLNKILDICSCTCFVNAPKCDINVEACHCPTKLKIPAEEIDFYADQKFERNMQITSYRDLKTTQKYVQEQAKLDRKSQREEPKRIQKQIARESSNLHSLDPTTEI